MKKITIVLLLLIINIFIFSNVILAYNLELILSADKTDVKVGDKVTVTLSLSQGMQAADFSINYDNNLLQFESASIGKNFYTTKEPGKIMCSWFDTNDTSKFTFTFVAIASGTAKFTTTTENFYNGNLQAASSYNEGNLNITLLSAVNAGNSSTITNVSNNQSVNTENNKEESNNSQTIQQIETKQEQTTINSSTKNINQTNTNKQSQINGQTSSTYNTQKTETSTTVQNTNLPQTRRRKHNINYRNIRCSNNCNNK